VYVNRMAFDHQPVVLDAVYPVQVIVPPADHPNSNLANLTITSAPPPVYSPSIIDQPKRSDQPSVTGFQATTFCPGLWSGKDWTTAGDNPQTKYLYIPANENLCGRIVGRPITYAAGRGFTGATNVLLVMDLERPERFLGMHWFNPPEWIPGVEVVPAIATDSGVVRRVVEFLRALGKRPAVVGAGVGFIANRLQSALFCEALRCVEDGLAGDWHTRNRPDARVGAPGWFGKLRHPPALYPKTV